MVKKSFFFFLIYLATLTTAFSQFFDESFTAEPEISTRVSYDKGLIVFTIEVPDGHHITDLKHGFFKIEVQKNGYIEVGAVRFPPGMPFADEMVYKGKFDVDVVVRPTRKISEPVDLKFTVGYQLCQEIPREVCFAPDSKDIVIRIEESFSGSGPEKNTDNGWIPSVGKTGAPQGNISENGSFFQKIERLLTRELEKQSLLLFLLAFVLGFFTSLTPCVYPVIPIIMGYVGSQAKGSKFRGFYLSLFFVLGLGLVYSALGVLAAASGSMIGASFQNPVVVVVIASIFILMGLSLAGLFEIPVPGSISSKIQAGGYKSKIFGSLIIGGVAGIIAAPCAGPVLIAILSWISQTRNLLMGFLIMFVFSLGMGVIFVLVGTFTGIISSLPKGGKWMSVIKNIFALLLIAGGLLVLGSIISGWVEMRLWAIFLIGLSVFMGLFKPIADDDIRKKFVKLVLVLIFLWGAVLFFKSFLPPGVFTPKSRAVIETIKLDWLPSLDEGIRMASRQNKKIMIDTYADWCVACKELDEMTFSTPEVRDVLKNFVLVKLDFTRQNERNRSLQKSLGIIGMPTVIFLSPQGLELKRFSGFKNKKEFLKIVSLL